MRHQRRLCDLLAESTAMSTFWRGYRNKPPAIAEGRGLAFCYGRHIRWKATYKNICDFFLFLIA